jgi:hypothetical protein
MLTSGRNLGGQFNRIGRRRFALGHFEAIPVGAGLLAKAGFRHKSFESAFAFASKPVPTELL